MTPEERAIYLFQQDHMLINMWFQTGVKFGLRDFADARWSRDNGFQNMCYLEWLADFYNVEDSDDVRDAFTRLRPVFLTAFMKGYESVEHP